MTELKPKRNQELRNCPFCGGEAEEKHMKRKKLFARFTFPPTTYFVYIRCKLCGATTTVMWTRENAIEAWNRRTGDTDENTTP